METSQTHKIHKYRGAEEADRGPHHAIEILKKNVILEHW